MAAMSLPRFKLRTLFVLTAIMGVVFIVCARWPVTEVSDALNSGLPGLMLTQEMVTVQRPPTPAEWAVRACVSSLAVLLAFALAATWRSTRVTAKEATSPPSGPFDGKPPEA
jgi:hypothetical protein